MRASWGYQLVDSYPDEWREQGQATEAEAALAALNEFPWAEQRRLLTARHRAGQTSTLPGLWLRRADETLRLLAPDPAGFLIEYRQGKRLYFRRLSHNWHDDHPLPDEPIRAFFAGTLADWPYWEEVVEAEAPAPQRLHYASSGRLPWRSMRKSLAKALVGYLLAGLLLVLAPVDWPWLLLLGLLGPLLLWMEVGPQWQKARLARGQRVEVDPQARRLTLHDRYGELTFGREQVRECVIVQNSTGARRQNEYIAFMLDSGQVCVIPRLTAPATALADALNAHYRLEQGRGFIRHRRRSTAELAAQEQQLRQLTAEFRQRFARHSTAELQTIVAQPAQYARPAVAAAAELLRQRGKSGQSTDRE